MIDRGHHERAPHSCNGTAASAQLRDTADSHLVSREMNMASHPWAECADGPWELRKAVRRRLREEPDAIKIWATGGNIWRWETAADQHYSMEEIQGSG